MLVKIVAKAKKSNHKVEKVYDAPRKGCDGRVCGTTELTRLLETKGSAGEHSASFLMELLYSAHMAAP